MEKIDIIFNCLLDWYGITWNHAELMDIAQYVALRNSNEFEDILNGLNEQMGDSVEDGELDGLAMEISEQLQEHETDNTYRNVRELTQDELDELKSKIYFLNTDNEDEMEEFVAVWDDEIEIEHEKMEYPTDISNETIYKLFDGISFVEEDFSCNLKGE